ncbi:hypothetical protein DXG03_000121 [Asterophora parasitica]|uniref:Uncharacterized protein n=1 Tax=Asterophora parasitica TaxID=117018 RepID=A0A9P7GKP4_9AGAR|nr:hypothetical protein DXG03_000121 [Asterophora parasitica]
MGKWTPDYIDDVLHSKLKSLVSGAIKRASLEKAEPTISYEDFVTDLDTGDSFTTSLIDILVKELAERRTRPNINDRRLIADRSAKSLRLLATPLRIYRDRSMGRYHPSRRTANLTDYLNAPPREMDVEEDHDEDIFERMLEGAPGPTIEGARITSDNLYEAYGTNVGPSTRTIASPSPPAEDLPSPPAIHPAPRWSVSAGLPPHMLTRQPSIRRPMHSRTVDFNDFTHRRRSATRENSATRDDSRATSEVREGSSTRTSQSARRFFPFMRMRRYDNSDPWGSDIHFSNNTEENGLIYPPENTPWFNMTPPLREPTTMEEVLADAELSEERSHREVVPRLRRGGLRAPESILSRHASPFLNPNPPETISEPESAPVAFNTASDAAPVMIRKRARPQTRVREISVEAEEDVPQPENEEEANLPLADLIELRKLRRARQGIDAAKLNKGDVRKKKKRVREEGDEGGLRKGAAPRPEDEEEDDEEKEARARRVVRANNFTQQTNALDVDKHMCAGSTCSVYYQALIRLRMAYIEENLKIRSKPRDDSDDDEKGPPDPQEALYALADRWKVDKQKPAEDGSVTNSLTMLTAIPEVDLGMDARLKNIEETEKAKRVVAEERQDRRKPFNDEEHLAASRFYRPNLKAKSDADILRDAKLEAMGLPPQDDQPRQSNNERQQMATDELVMERFKKRMRKQ